ncbi:altered inheritance of mitochondria protein 9 [Trichophyton mentagrophytes]|nr:altered inheritance of mitochondria protein 9 [Trichophyton mentagrophytes]
MPQSLKLLFSQSFCRISRAFLPTRSFSRVSAAQNAEVDIHNGKGLASGLGQFYSELTSQSADWNSHEDFFSFTRGRFVVAEADQLVQRCVRFNMNELARIAAQSVGARACVNVQKCPDGMYNKCFVLTMDDGQEVIAKVPNPNAGLPHQTTASEVATMDFARNVLGTPAPKVYAWNSGTTNTVGAEYIIMERMPGVQLRQVWSSMKLVEKMNLCLDIARYQSAWLSVTFSQFGGLYYTQDVQNCFSQQKTHLYVDENGAKVQNSRFTIGPVTSREWFDCGRAGLECDRGPWRSVYDYYKAIGHREKLAISTLGTLPKQTVMVCGPGLYQPDRSKKLSAVEWYLQIVDALIPTESGSITTPCLWHDDLHDENIFVDPSNPSKVTGIIDWQSVSLLPLLDHNPDASFIDYDGPEPENLDRPELGNIDNLSELEKEEAVRKLHQKALFIASRKIMLKKAPKAYDAIEYQRTESYDLLVLARRLFEFGEAHFHALVVELREAWAGLPANNTNMNHTKPFPITLTEDQIAEIETDCQNAIRGMQIMNDFKARLGPLWLDKDAVGHEQYNATKDALRVLREEIIQEFGKSEADKIEIKRQWPFDE